MSKYEYISPLAGEYQSQIGLVTAAGEVEYSESQVKLGGRGAFAGGATTAGESGGWRNVELCAEDDGIVRGEWRDYRPDGSVYMHGPAEFACDGTDRLVGVWRADGMYPVHDEYRDMGPWVLQRVVEVNPLDTLSATPHSPIVALAPAFSE
jgi:hypothetical protein